LFGSNEIAAALDLIGNSPLHESRFIGERLRVERWGSFV
jgi:hypothetical protein